MIASRTLDEAVFDAQYHVDSQSLQAWIARKLFLVDWDVVSTASLAIPARRILWDLHPLYLFTSAAPRWQAKRASVTTGQPKHPAGVTSAQVLAGS
jgi:hypothetical protein